jgi:hypothetical protein
VGRGLAVGGGGRRRSGEVIALPVPVVGLNSRRLQQTQLSPGYSLAYPKTTIYLVPPAGFEPDRLFGVAGFSSCGFYASTCVSAFSPQRQYRALPDMAVH